MKTFTYENGGFTESDQPELTYTPIEAHPEYVRVRAQRESYGEANDCTVIALSIAVGIPYDVAHGMLLLAGRRNCHGFMMTAWLADKAKLGETVCGYKFTQVDCGELDKSALPAYSRRPLYKYKTVAQVRRDFPKGRFILSIHKHVFAMIDGVILDYTSPRSRVKRLTLVERA